MHCCFESKMNYSCHWYECSFRRRIKEKKNEKINRIQITWKGKTMLGKTIWGSGFPYWNLSFPFINCKEWRRHAILSFRIGCWMTQSWILIKHRKHSTKCKIGGRKENFPWTTTDDTERGLFIFFFKTKKSIVCSEPSITIYFIDRWVDYYNIECIYFIWSIDTLYAGTMRYILMVMLYIVYPKSNSFLSFEDKQKGHTKCENFETWNDQAQIELELFLTATVLVIIPADRNGPPPAKSTIFSLLINSQRNIICD